MGFFAGEAGRGVLVAYSASSVGAGAGAGMQSEWEIGAARECIGLHWRRREDGELASAQ